MGWKTACQNAKMQYDALGRSPPGFDRPVSRFRTPGWYCSEMATCQIWRESAETGGARVENVFCGLFCCFSEMACFHVHIFVAFYSIRVKGCTVVVSSMVYNCVNGKGHCIKVTQVIAV